MSKYYHHLDLPDLPEKYITEAINSDYKLITKPRLYWADSTFNKTNFFKLLDLRFGGCYVKYYFTPPNALYNWHIDLNRHCAINWVVKNNAEARTLFREPIEEASGGMENPIFFHLDELKYRGHKPTLLNGTYSHCVTNNFPDSRIILSMSLFKPTKYEDVLTFLQESRDIKAILEEY